MRPAATLCTVSLSTLLLAACGGVERGDDAPPWDGNGIDGWEDDAATTTGADDEGEEPAGSDGVDGSGDDGSPPDDSGDDGGSTGEEPPPAGSPDVPDNEYCASVADWDEAWVQQELEMLALVNELRAEPHECAPGGVVFGPSEPLELHPALRCSARVHVKDMVDNDFFDHTGSDGSSYQDRANAAGYAGFVAEDLGDGYFGAAQAVAGWLGSPAHCIYMLGDYQYGGVAHRTGARRSWALVMGK